MPTSPRLSLTVGNIRPAVFAQLQARIDAFAARGEELVPLHIGDTHLLPPEAARAAFDALAGTDAGLFRYGPTAGMPSLREAVADAVSGRGLSVDPALQVIVGNGGTHAFFCAARATLDPGDEVLVASPYWPLAPGVLASCGAVPIDVPVTQRLYQDPALDPAALLGPAIGPRTRAIYLISPNNPDGKVLTAAQLARIADVARAHDLWVFSDEVYADTVFEGTHVSIATLEGMAERTMVIGSLSKSHALAGCRVGYVVAPEPVVHAARRVSTHTAFNVSVAMQRAAVAAMSDSAFSARAAEAYREARDATCDLLAQGPLAFHRPEGATYVFVDFATVLAPGASVLEILGRAVDRGVLLAPGDAFGATYGTHARLCFTSVPLPRVRAGIERLLEAVDAYQRTV